MIYCGIDICREIIDLIDLTLLPFYHGTMFNKSIATDRLILRPYGKKDLTDVIALRSDSRIWTYSTVTPSDDPSSAETYLNGILENYGKNEPAFMALLENNSGRFVGEAGVLSYRKEPNRAVIGYNLLPEFWGKGYATEISRSLVSFLFDDIGVERIEALVVENNDASAKVLTKCGFQKEGFLRNFGRIRGIYVNLFYFGMIREDYERLSS